MTSTPYECYRRLSRLLFLAAVRLAALRGAAFFEAAFLAAAFLIAFFAPAFFAAGLVGLFTVFFAVRERPAAADRFTIPALFFVAADFFFAGLAPPLALAGVAAFFRVALRAFLRLGCSAAAAVSALTILLKLLFWLPDVSSSYSRAKFRSSSLSKNCSQVIGSNVSSPL